MKKRIYCVVLSAAMVLGLAAGSAAVMAEESAEAVKTGLSIVASMDGSADAGEEDGKANTDIVIAAVTVDEAGVIDDCVIDTIQVRANFDAAGAVTTDLASVYQSKKELGEDYGMKAASGIGKEWYEQAEALEDYVIGKTLDEVKGIAVDESGVAADEDLAASCTVHIGGYLAAIEDAYNQAEERGANKGDKLSLVSTTNIGHSKDAAEDADGLVQAYATIAAITTSDDVVTSCYIDAVQANVAFNNQGVITSDLTATPKTKNQLKEDYGMKAASGIGKEWYEQAASFCEYVTGKTVAEVTGIAVDDSGKAADEDLSASVTIGIGGFIELFGKIQ